jgi:DNA-binding transcriptional LysR family regulator
VLFPRAHNPGFYDRVLAAFSRAGVTPRIAEEVWPRANAVGLVRAGLGATFMCPSEARPLPEGVAFRPLDGPAPESRLVVGWRAAESNPEPALASFLAVAAPAG